MRQRRERIRRLMKEIKRNGGMRAALAVLFFCMLLGMVIFLGHWQRPGEQGDAVVTGENESRDEEAFAEGEAEDIEENRENRKDEENKREARKDTGKRRRPVVPALPLDVEAEWEEAEERGPLKLVFASDMHLLGASLHDEGKAFQEKIRRDDGKVIPFGREIVEAFLAEAASLNADVVVLHGDLTFEGERESHEELAGILRQAQEKGLQILVVPGNHDINNLVASSYFGEKTMPADSVTAEEFLEIYHEFGYDQALSRDEASLSYTYAVDEHTWLLMLDTNDYEPAGKVGGKIEQETLQWMAEQLELADKEGVQVIPVGHHNLLQESRLYPFDCTIEGNEEIIQLFEQHKLPLYISGHLHAARVKKHRTAPGVSEEEYGIREIVTSSLSMSPCQYLLLTWDEDAEAVRGEAVEVMRDAGKEMTGNQNAEAAQDEDEEMVENKDAETARDKDVEMAENEDVEAAWKGEMEPVWEFRQTDVEAWAMGRTEDSRLLNFREFSQNWYYEMIGGQIRDKLAVSLTEKNELEMGWFYADLLYHYCAGIPLSGAKMRRAEGYQLWERFGPDEASLEEMELMLKDNTEVPAVPEP